MDTTGRNPWVVLGLPESASYEMARAAFRRKASQTHPDHGGHPRSFLEVQDAWNQIRTVLVARPGARPNPYRRLITPDRSRRDLLETPTPHSARPAIPVGDLRFAAVLEHELRHLAAA